MARMRRSCVLTSLSAPREVGPWLTGGGAPARQAHMLAEAVWVMENGGGDGREG